MYRALLVVGLVFLVSADYDLSEGEPCVRDGIQGTCRHIRFCPTVTMVDLISYEPKHPPICSFDGNNPIVCCTDCNITDVSNVVITLDGVRHKLGTNKSYDNCLEYISKLPYTCKVDVKTRVVKLLDTQKQCHYLHVAKVYLLIGHLAKRGEFPHMALVGYGSEPEPVQWACGGSIISERYILTAAHCSHHPRLGPASEVALGILRRSDPADTWQRRRVRRFLTHPDYRPPNKYHDIALIQTDDTIKFSPLVLPICLADRELPVTQTGAQAEGWGAEGHNKPSSDGLRKAWLERFSAEECSELYPEHRHLPAGVDTRTQVCYGDRKDNKDTCQGDSGGPLQAWGGRQCVNYVVGVTSYGRACGARGGAGIYTRVLPYRAWIEGHVWP